MESVSLGDYTVWRVEASKLWPRNMYYRETICPNCVSEELGNGSHLSPLSVEIKQHLKFISCNGFGIGLTF